MIINNENNRTNVEASVEEALELIAELSKAVNFALQHGHRTTNGMAASERIPAQQDLLVSRGAHYRPSSFNVSVARETK